ncbi:MAG: hypothetical protein R2705_21680 [Ilumatobacteraceae bacterium]
MDEPLASAVRRGPLADIDTVYTLPDGRRCVVTFANRGSDQLHPVRRSTGDLWVAFLASDDTEPPAWEDWERDWVPAEWLLPTGRLDRRRQRH